MSVYGSPKTVLQVYPVFCDVLFDLLNGPEPAKKQVAVETIALIGSSAEGKLLLHEQGS